MQTNSRDVSYIYHIYIYIYIYIYAHTYSNTAGNLYNINK